MSIVLSPNMNLPIPTVGNEAGPQYAQDANNSLTLLDAHDHSAGKGTPVNPTGLNINSDLTFNSNNATNLRTAKFFPQTAVLTNPSDIGCLYEVGVDLYYNDGNGNNVKITQDGGVAGSPGSISNLTSPASASYVSASSTFVWQSAANTSANMDFASATFRNLTANSFGLTLQPPSGMSANFAITLPSLPSATSFVTMDASGTMAASPTVQSILDLINQLVPPGSVISYGGLTAPANWLLCDGTAVSRTTYAALFNIVGVNFGSGDGSTTFNVPDFRGQFLRGVDGAAGRDPDSGSRTAMNPGGNTGNNVGSVQGNALQSHTHSASSEFTSPGGGAFSVTSGNNFVSPGFATPTNFTVNTPNSGSISTETRPTNGYINFIIKV